MMTPQVLSALLLAARAPAQPAWSAKLAELKGLARVAPRGREWHAVQAGARLEPEDVLTVLPESRARLEFPDGTRVTLGPLATLTVQAPSGRARGVALLRGAARIFAARQGEGEFTVTTPTAVAAVKGTRFAVAVDGDATEIRVAEGAVLCSDRARRYAVLMRAGEAATWDDRGLWKPVRRLSAEEAAEVGDDGAPAAEARLAGPAGVRLGGYVTLNYTAMRGATGKSDPRFDLSPLNPLEIARGNTHGGFSNPWLSVQAASRLGDRARTVWELWLTQGGTNPFPTVDNFHGRLEILDAYAEADLVRAAHGAPPLVLRAGIFPVPLGLLNQGFVLPLRTFTTVPLFASRMIPVPYQDVGAELAGGFTTAWGTLRWQAASVNGLQVEPTDSWQPPLVESDGLWWARPTEDERFLGQDNNPNRAGAGRIGWSTPALSFGVSGYAGKADKDNVRDLTIAAGDAALSLELPAARLAVRGEGGKVALAGPPGMFAGWPETGGYAEAEVSPVGWPVSAGLGWSQVNRNPRASGPRHRDEAYAAVAWRFVPEMLFKLEARREVSAGVTPPLEGLTAQVSAFW